MIDDDNVKVKGHHHVTDKFWGAAHWDCNINLTISKNVKVIFHNFHGYDSHLIFPELSKFDVKIEAIPNRLEKYMAFILNRDLVFIDIMQFMNSSLDSLVKNLSENDFKYLIKEFGSENLKLLRQKGAHPYEYMNRLERFEETELCRKECFFNSLKNGKTDDDGKKIDGHISDEEYSVCK